MARLGCWFRHWQRASFVSGSTAGGSFQIPDQRSCNSDHVML